MQSRVILTIISGELYGKQLLFEEPASWTIGRAKNCNLCFPDSDLYNGISRYHCLLEINPPEVSIRDLGSTNGTLVNDRLIGHIDPEESLLSNERSNEAYHSLKSGDTINIGDTIFEVEIEVINPQKVEVASVSVTSAEEPKKSLKQLAIKGTSWTLIGYGFTQLLRFGSNLTLTYLLSPSILGLVGLVYVVFGGIQLFSDFGLHQNIVQNRRGEEPNFLNTAWTIQVIRGIFLWMVCGILAVPAANFYNEPQFTWLLPVVGLTAAIAGFNSMSLALLNRHLAVGKQTILEIVVYIVQLIVTIACAIEYRNVWSLVAGGVAAAIAKLIISYYINPKTKHKFAWDKTVVQEMFGFSIGIFLSTMIGFIATQSDKIILGKFFSVELIGIYMIAYTLSDIPRQVIARLSNGVIFPLVSKQAELPREVLLQKILKSRKIFIVLSGLLLAAIVGFGDLLILFAYDSRYHEAAWMLRILSLGLWQTLLYRMGGSILIALGKTYYYTLGSISTTICLCVGLTSMLYFKGLAAGIIVIAFADLPQYFIISYGLWKERLNCFSQDVLYTIFYLGLLGLTFGLRNLFFS
jgi:O-antigen/teichoic acid export membrane protein